MKESGPTRTKTDLDARIDQLYAGPLETFTADRNALAKEAGPRAAEIRGLVKANVAAWAVNQLYWHRRKEYHALIDAAGALRKAHAAVLAGKSADIRAASKGHENQLASAIDKALGILREGGHPVTDATRQAIVTTLRALPADAVPGRLTAPLQPGGFEALAGLSINGARTPSPKPAPAPPTSHEKDKPRDTKAQARAREALAAAAGAVKQAEHAAQREEFERARAAREVERAKKAAAAARDALEEAESELRKAEAAEAAAVRKQESADRRAEQAEEALSAARERLEAAQKAGR